MKGLAIREVWNGYALRRRTISAEKSVENGTKRLGTKKTCQICEPRQTGYRLIPSRPCKWGKKKKETQEKRNCMSRRCLRCLISNIFIYIFQTYMASLCLQSSISSNQSNGLRQSHAFVLDFIKRRSPGCSHHWLLLITLIGTLTSLRAAWPQRSFISSELAVRLDQSSSARKKIKKEKNAVLYLLTEGVTRFSIRASFVCPRCCFQGETLTSWWKGIHPEKAGDHRGNGEGKTRRDGGIKDS